MPVSNAPAQYLANGGFNFILPITVADLNTTAATSKVLTVGKIPADAMVFDVGYYLITGFAGGSVSALTVKIGDTDSDNGFVTATSVLTGNSPLSSKANTGAYFTGTDSGSATLANSMKAKNYDNSGTKDLTVTFTATGANLTDLTTGKLVVFAKIADLTAIA